MPGLREGLWGGESECWSSAHLTGSKRPSEQGRWEAASQPDSPRAAGNPKPKATYLDAIVCCWGLLDATPSVHKISGFFFSVLLCFAK